MLLFQFDFQRRRKGNLTFPIYDACPVFTFVLFKESDRKSSVTFKYSAVSVRLLQLYLYAFTIPDSPFFMRPENLSCTVSVFCVFPVIVYQKKEKGGYINGTDFKNAVLTEILRQISQPGEGA